MSPPTRFGTRSGGGGGRSGRTVPSKPPTTPPGMPPGTPPTSPPSSSKSTAFSGWMPRGISAGAVNVCPEAGAGAGVAAAACSVFGHWAEEVAAAAVARALPPRTPSSSGLSGSSPDAPNSSAATMLPTTTRCVVRDTTVAPECVSRNGRSSVSDVRSNIVTPSMRGPV